LQCIVEGLCWLELAAQSGLPCYLNGSDVCSADLSLMSVFAQLRDTA
jgi:hypothetical protein